MNIRLFEFLAPLYPDERESFRVRTFGPREYPGYLDKQSPKPFGDIFSREYTVTRALLRDDRQLQERIKKENQLSGMYFVVNAGISEAKQLPLGVVARKSKYGEIPQWTQYVEDGDITRFNAFFAESDDKSIGEQIAQIERCPLWPSIWNITYKSVHSFWPCAPGVTLEEWRDIQARLIAYFGGDDKIKNPSRVMRLPNLNHVKYDPDTQMMSYKRIEIARFDPDRRFTVEEMRTAFPAVKTESVNWETPTAGSGEFQTWEELGNELRRRMAAHPTAHIQNGKVVLKGVCHDGKGDSALFFNIATGKYHCDHPGCRKEDILTAFGLPDRPIGKPEFKFKGRIVPAHARAVRITDTPWTADPVVVDFVARLKASRALPSVAVEALPPADAVVDNAAIESASLESGIVDDTPIARSVGKCGDCNHVSPLFGSWCFQCSELRRFLNDGANALPCGCVGVNRWRYSDGGFYWHCSVHETAPANVVWSFGANVIKFPESSMMVQ